MRNVIKVPSLWNKTSWACFKLCRFVQERLIFYWKHFCYHWFDLNNRPKITFGHKSTEVNSVPLLLLCLSRSSGSSRTGKGSLLQVPDVPGGPVRHRAARGNLPPEAQLLRSRQTEKDPVCQQSDPVRHQEVRRGWSSRSEPPSVIIWTQKPERLVTHTQSGHQFSVSDPKCVCGKQAPHFFSETGEQSFGAWQKNL